jgi:hypothetical protein
MLARIVVVLASVALLGASSTTGTPSSTSSRGMRTGLGGIAQVAVCRIESRSAAWAPQRV